ncbi:unnamed protein product [Leptosia nina]|uniref:Arrestin C-terminal-like domain-containing protein n=1 Tax=Leptosia nina TaxID=320188 RepID=A0AAV1JI67_9NEOP
MTTDNGLNSQRVFKKSSPNNKLTMYLASRDLIVENGSIDKIQGVLHVDGSLENKKLFGQVTLTFRYGREDEEVMGLKFCNEAIMSLVQIWPLHCKHDVEPNSPLQDALIKRLGANVFPFHLELTPLAPPSVQLVPAKQYHGAPIGTSYDVRAYIADQADEKISRRNTVRMGIRVLQGAGRPQPAVLPTQSTQHPLSVLAHHNVLRLKGKIKSETDQSSRPKTDEIENQEPTPPRVAVEKPFLLSDGRVELEAWLDKATYAHGESVNVSVNIINHSSKTIRRIKVLIIQHVDVCMFSNGKFKNVVALLRGSGTPVLPDQTHNNTYTLTPHRGVTKNWIALEDSYSKSGASLASTVLCSSKSQDERNVFAIYVSYYVKVKLTLSAMGGEVSVKLPFTLTHSCINEAPTDSVIEEATHKMILEGKELDEIKVEVKDKQNKNGGPKPEFDETEEKSPEDHKCVADVLVNIENQIAKPIVTIPKQFAAAKCSNEEFDLIEKYPGTDT